MEYTYREKRLIHKWIECHDIKETAKYADLSENYVKNFVKKNKAKLKFLDDNRTFVTKDYVLRHLQEVVNRSLEGHQKLTFDKESKEYVPTYDIDGNIVYEYDASAALKALEMIGKHKKMFVDRNENTNTSLSYDEYIKNMNGDEY